MTDVDTKGAKSKCIATTLVWVTMIKIHHLTGQLRCCISFIRT